MACAFEPKQQCVHPSRHAISQGSINFSSEADIEDKADLSECHEEFHALPNMAPASLRRARTKSKRGRGSVHWRLVWCHEGVHKPDCEAKRCAIGEATKKVKGSLVCPKKASKFSMWLSQTRRLPYVLVTDWREVKPCLQAAAALPDGQRPAFTVVLAEQQCQYERASRWVTRLPLDAEPVHVCRDMSLLSLFLDSLAAADEPSESRRMPECIAQALCAKMQDVKSQVDAPAPQKPTNEAIKVRAVESTGTIPQGKVRKRWAELLEEELSEASASNDRMPPPALEEEAGAAMEQERAGCAVPQATTVGAGAAFLELRSGEPATDTSKRSSSKQRKTAIGFGLPTLVALASSHTPLQLEQVLRQAMPDRYND